MDQVPDLPKGLVAVSRKLPAAPSSEEVAVMLQAPGSLGLAISLAAFAGLRMGEVRALEVRDVDFEQHRLLVRRALSDEISLTYLRRSRLKEWSFHSLRHLFVTQLMRSGTSAEVVRVLAGHSKLEMTQRYAHAEAPDLRAAIDKLGG